MTLLPDTPETPPEEEAGSPYLTTRQASAYLHLNEKKLYELARDGYLPALRLSGKWLFPKQLLDEFLLEQAHSGALTDRITLAAEDDPWLERALGHLGQELDETACIARSTADTLAGLKLLAHRRVSACLLHWGPERRAPQQHGALLRQLPGHDTWTRVQLARRQQGVLLRPGLESDSLATLAAFDHRWALRSPGSGSQHFLALALQEAGFLPDDCPAARIVCSEREAAFALLHDEADCAPGSLAGAREFGLNFLPLGWEMLELVMPRPLFFRHLLRQFLDSLASPAATSLAEHLGGYDLSPLGRVVSP